MNKIFTLDKIHIFIFALILLCKTAGYAQKEGKLLDDCRLFQQQADSLYNIGCLRQSIYYDSKALLTCSDINPAYNRLAKAHALLNEKDSAFFYLELSLQADSNFLSLFDCGEYYSLLTDSRWDDIASKQIEKFEKKFGAIKKKDVAKWLGNLRIRDQAYYYEIFLYENLNLSDSSSNYWHLKECINRRNLTELGEFIAKEGWPKNSEVGGTGEVNGAAFLVIQHCGELDTMKKYLPYLEKCVDEREAKKGNLALLIDRINQMEGKPQVYGTQISYDSEKKIYYLDKVIDPKNLNMRRAEMDMIPIEEYLKMWNAERRIETEK